MVVQPIEEQLSASLKDVEEGVDLEILKDMIKAALMYGHSRTRTNPKFKPFIFSNRNNIEIIDLGMTLKKLGEAIELLKNKMKDKGIVLVVATQPAAKEAADKLIKEFNFCYINSRWIGGLLTNFNILSKRIEYFKKLQADLEKGEFDKYTKKEKLGITKQIAKMKKIFNGLENLSKKPDVVLIIDPALKEHKTAIRETKKCGIPTIAVLDSDDDPTSVDYPIPANDHAKMSIDWIVDKIIKELK